MELGSAPSLIQLTSLLCNYEYGLALIPSFQKLQQRITSLLKTMRPVLKVLDLPACHKRRIFFEKGFETEAGNQVVDYEAIQVQ